MQTRQKVLARSCEVNLGQRPEILVIAIPPQTCHYYSRHHLLHGYLNLILCQSPSSLAWTLAPALRRISTASLRPYPAQGNIDLPGQRSLIGIYFHHMIWRIRIYVFWPSPGTYLCSGEVSMTRIYLHLSKRDVFKEGIKLHLQQAHLLQSEGGSSSCQQCLWHSHSEV